MAVELPSICTIHSDRRSYRIWKRILRHAGKRRTFDLLEPQIRVLSKKINNRRYSKTEFSSTRPTDLKNKLLEACSEIRESRELVQATEIADGYTEFMYGPSGVSRSVLATGAWLVMAMLADRGFELYLLACLLELVEIDPNFVQDVGLDLKDRAI